MKSFFLLILMLGNLSMYAQMDLNKIVWEKDGKLTWEDFQGTPQKDSKFHATTNSGITYSWKISARNNKIDLQYEVINYFVVDNSWVVKGSESEYLLKHEQAHFDISEIHARNLRKKLKEISLTGIAPKEVSKLLKDLYQVVDQERTEMQLKFDEDTNHSVNTGVEARWEKYIEFELKKLEAYKS
ncbi:DUF922 domain-containing protein [Gillisia sp. M10.2A]|uniref:DUF922 domain-containing protein n=1 Tax=Gillisia lutea TaxID=2909668 RepID=A0ABS9EEI5_9FLAO|nr:DUF922 domain-containing protein [Gillisia lutea]MCF4101273.1 DUF922 domain-containing protein [Gillisia lutea]